MPELKALREQYRPDWEGLLNVIKRAGTPGRVYNVELFQDQPVADAIAERFGLTDGLDAGDGDFERKKYIAVQRFCGYDFVLSRVVGAGHQFTTLESEEGRAWMEEHRGPITNWEEFEKYPWPDPGNPEATSELEWYEQNLPDDMCVIGGLVGHLVEELSFLMGYESLCYALSDQPDLVRALADRILGLHRRCTELLLQFDRVKMIWGSDDMGFKTGTLISPDDMRRFVLGGHKELAAMSHAAGRPYLLHSCGNLAEILDDLVDDVKIDAKHSFEDTIEDVRDAKRGYGHRVALLGGIDVDFLCRSDEAAIRKRVRQTLDVCQEGGGYALGTGNSVAEYIPLDNYLIMLDEGRLYGR